MSDVSTPQVVVCPDEQSVASSVADALVDWLASPGIHHLVVTGGGVGTLVLACLRERQESVDWQRVHVWWGDERFVQRGDPERNETGARTALLDHVPIPPDQVHPMPADEGQSPDDAARAYADELAACSTDGIAPQFGVLLLGMGPEGHVASIFPDSPAAHAAASITPVRDCPKPPPTRISMTFPTLRSADEVWVVASGESKAGAAARALASGTSAFDVPAAGARGRQRTVFWLDEAAAGR